MRRRLFERNTTASQEGARSIPYRGERSRQVRGKLGEEQGHQKTQDRPFGTLRAGNRDRESRAAVARMKYFGTCEIGVQQARDK
jgi:hypothetical protein